VINECSKGIARFHNICQAQLLFVTQEDKQRFIDLLHAKMTGNGRLRMFRRHTES